MVVDYIKHKNIDKQKWDICVDNAVNGLIYGKSFYLDNMASNCDGIVLGDYKAVMPIIWRSKWGIRYLYQPAFLQQGGIFFATELSEFIIKSFFNILIAHFKFAEITGNFLSFPPENISGINTSSCNNFCINFKDDYSAILKNYTFSCKKSLTRIKKFQLTYQKSTDSSFIIELYKNLYKRKLSNISDKDYVNFKNICKNLMVQEQVIIRHVYDTNNQLLCAALLIKDRNRIYNIINCVTVAGKKLEANYFLYDNLLREFSLQKLLFDFEGSDVAGIKNFYLKFNPDNQPYPFIKFNNLNPILKLFKH